MTPFRCRGNIILEQDESNATRLLLDRLQATTLTKDKEYFLATGTPTTSGPDAQVDMVRIHHYLLKSLITPAPLRCLSLSLFECEVNR